MLLIYVIIFLGAMILSNIVHTIFSKIPLPLVQLILGFLFGLFLKNNMLGLDSNIFLALVIAPLLFREGEESDVTSIMKHWRTVLFLAFILVFITIFSVGFSVHLLMTSLPMAACFAVGAALGPTDLVAMSSLSSTFNFPKWVANVLKGEGLINDASGLISFKFAILALATGTFSASKAGLVILGASLGGALVGLIVGWSNQVILKFLDEISANNVTGYMLMEITLPFLSFFLAEELHASGIIAAVTSGIMQAARFKKITLFDAKVDSVANSLWGILNFAMNSVVFVMLGVELERAFFLIIKQNLGDNINLLLTIITITLILFTTRFVSLALYYRFLSWRRKKSYERYLRDILLITFAGIKGTVSVATILLTPSGVNTTEFTYRSNMLVLVSGVAFCSFVIGLIVLPILGEKKEKIKDYRIEIAILEDVMMQLEQDATEFRNRIGMDAAIDNYRVRIRKLIIDSESDDIKDDLYELRFLMLKIEMEGLEEAFRKRKVNEHAYDYYVSYIVDNRRSILTHSSISTFNFLLMVLRRIFFGFGHLKTRITRRRRGRNLNNEERKMLRDLYLQNTELILSALEDLEDVYDSVLVDYLQSEQIRMTEKVNDQSFIERLIVKARPNNIEEMMRGFYLERKIIFEYEQEGLLTSKKALKLQKNVNTLESYSLQDDYSNLPYEIFDFLIHHRTG